MFLSFLLSTRSLRCFHHAEKHSSRLGPVSPPRAEEAHIVNVTSGDENKMLSTFLDRVWTPTALYALTTYLLWTFRTHTSEKLTLGLLVALTAYWAHVLLNAVLHERKLESLGGGRAPVKRTLTPFNLYTIFEAVYYFSHHRNHEFWWGFFGRLKAWTVETDILASRLIFTADEENVKAILATQFADYGKGERFQRVGGALPLPVFLPHQQSLGLIVGEKLMNCRSGMTFSD